MEGSEQMCVWHSSTAGLNHNTNLQWTINASYSAPREKDSQNVCKIRVAFNQQLCDGIHLVST